jgi:hypothetical protein
MNFDSPSFFGYIGKYSYTAVTACANPGVVAFSPIILVSPIETVLV